MIEPDELTLGIPKGRMQEAVLRLMADSGFEVRFGERDYRMKRDSLELKLLKPQNIVEMLAVGSRDIGFAGQDWVSEIGGDSESRIVEVLDTGLNPVAIVAAAPEMLLEEGKLPKRALVVASEYESITQSWIRSRGIDARFVRSYGATEVFPPDDADCIVDNTATGSTLRANKLCIVEEIMRSTTRLYASERAMKNPGKRAAIEDMKVCISSVLAARDKVMIEINSDASCIDTIIEILPCMRSPTISRLSGSSGFAIKVAAPKSSLSRLIPEIRKRGGTDIVVFEPSRIVLEESR